MIIWLASYPKSGNTWLRALLSSYFFSDTNEFNFKLLGKIDSFPSVRYFSNFNDNFLNSTDTAKYWIKAQSIINKQKKGIKFFKTHSALYKINNYSFTNEENSLGAIQIVRDPRNVITSICNHYQLTYDDALTFMKNKKKAIYSKTNGRYLAFQPILSWSLNYKSWSKNENIKTLLIKYENLEQETFLTFKNILIFIKKITNSELLIDDLKIKKCIKNCSFETLEKLEKENGFNEAPKKKNSQERLKFFNLGKKNRWKDILEKNISDEIEKEFNKEMIELGYL